MFARALAVAAALFVAGCWTHEGSLYGSVTAVQPLKSGTYLRTGKQVVREELFVLTATPNGFYRMRQIIGGADADQLYQFRLFPMQGAPLNTYLFEAAPLTCQPKGPCADPTATTTYLYGIARMNADGIDEIDPDCGDDKMRAIAMAHGATAPKDGACAFQTRLGLEAALTEALAQGKPDYHYHLKGPTP